MFDQCMYFNTAALARALEREWAAAFKPLGLAPPQAFMLRAVIRRPGLFQSELANALAISRPTATRGLDGLAAKGFIDRQPTGQDGRQIAIHPTEHAIAIATRLDEASAKVTERLKKQLGESFFQDLVAEMRDVRTALK
ncbi:MAG: MarR family transcriptional regulator [Desulfobulbaceae bacterium]|nr:MarR family transcriptional regulator [Desulfobulbaceae bacterium]